MSPGLNVILSSSSTGLGSRSGSGSGSGSGLLGRTTIIKCYIVDSFVKIKDNNEYKEFLPFCIS